MGGGGGGGGVWPGDKATISLAWLDLPSAKNMRHTRLRTYLTLE